LNSAGFADDGVQFVAATSISLTPTCQQVHYTLRYLLQVLYDTKHGKDYKADMIATSTEYDATWL
jgi:hypothetical protein